MSRPYTDEQIAWLKANVPYRPHRVCRIEFMAIFERPLTEGMLANLVRKHGLHGAPNLGRYKEGNVPANKGRLGQCAPGSEKGWFREGHGGTRNVPL